MEGILRATGGPGPARARPVGGPLPVDPRTRLITADRWCAYWIAARHSTCKAMGIRIIARFTAIT